MSDKKKKQDGSSVMSPEEMRYKKMEILYKLQMPQSQSKKLRLGVEPEELVPDEEFQVAQPVPMAGNRSGEDGEDKKKKRRIRTSETA